MTTLFISVITIYLLIMIVVGYLCSRRIASLEDYLIAGRRLPFYLAVPTIVATWFGAGSCMGVSGTVYSKGFYGVIADPFGCSLALMIAGLFFAIPLRRLNVLTLSDILEKSYGPFFARVATLLTIPFYIGTLASNMLAMGYLFQVVFGGSLEWGVLFGSVIVLLYTVTGGMWAVTITDFIQMLLLILGLLLVTFVCLKHAKDISLVSQTFWHEWTTLMPNETSNLRWSSYLGRIFMTGLGAIMGQDLIQRIVASRNQKTARSSTITAGLVYFCLGLIPLFVGIAGRDILPNLEKPEQLMLLLAQQHLSPIIFMVFSCGLLAAIMSTADSYLLAGATLLVNNIFLKMYPIKMEKNKIKLIRWTNIIFALLAFIIALSGTSIFDLMVHSGATLFVSIFVPSCAALFWKTKHPFAAWCSMLGGLFIWLMYIVVNLLFSKIEYEEVLFSAAFYGAIVSFIIMVCGVFLAKFYKIPAMPMANGDLQLKR